jgi:hypothetical protein
MAKATRKRKPAAARGKRRGFADLLDIKPSRAAKKRETPEQRKKMLEQVAQMWVQGWDDFSQSIAVLRVPTLDDVTPPPPSKERRKAGVKPKYDWDAIQARCHQQFDDNGFPENVSAFCRDEIVPWCEQRYGESGTPDIETLRPRVTKWIAAWERSLLPK